MLCQPPIDLSNRFSGESVVDRQHRRNEKVKEGIRCDFPPKKQEQTQKPVDPKRQQVRNRSRVFGRLFARLVTQFPATVSLWSSSSSLSSSSLSSSSLQSLPQPVPTSLKSFVFCFPLPEYEMPTRLLKRSSHRISITVGNKIKSNRLYIESKKNSWTKIV